MRFQSIVLAAVAALSSSVVAQDSAISAAESAASGLVSSATGSVASSASSIASSLTERSSTSSASSTESDSSSITSSASATSSSSDDDEEPTSTRVYTTTYYYLTQNPTHNAVSPTLLIESVVKSTSGQENQQSFSTPTGSVTLLTVSRSTYTTTYTSENPIHNAVSQYFTVTSVITTTAGLPEPESEGAASKVGAREIGGVAAFFLGLAGMYL